MLQQHRRYLELDLGDVHLQWAAVTEVVALILVATVVMVVEALVHLVKTVNCVGVATTTIYFCAFCFSDALHKPSICIISNKHIALRRPLIVSFHRRAL